MGNTKSEQSSTLRKNKAPFKIKENATIFAAEIMLKQIEEQPNCMHWLMMSLAKLLSINSTMSIKELYEKLSNLYPYRFAMVQKRLKEIYNEEGIGDL